MASVAPPKPGYRPHVLDRLVTDCVLSDAQLESLIYAGEAHAGFLARHYAVDETFDAVSAVDPGTPGAVRFRSEEHTSELQSLMRISYAVFCFKKKNTHTEQKSPH